MAICRQVDGLKAEKVGDALDHKALFAKFSL